MDNKTKRSFTTSVIISTYNGQKCIIEQLDSIRTQTQKVNEVIICDDCSSDNTVQIIKNYIDNNDLKGWILHVNGENVGWKNNYAHLIKLATQDIIFFCDQDDIWRKDKVEKSCECFCKDNKLMLLVSDLKVLYMSDNVNKYIVQSLGDEKYQHLRLKAKYCEIMRPGCVYAVNRKYAQKCFEKCWKNDTEHDLLMWHYAFANDAIGYIKEELITYRRFSSSETAVVKKSGRVDRVSLNRRFLNSLDAVANGIPNEVLRRNKKFRRYYRLQQLRKELFSRRNLLFWVMCLIYFDAYPHKRFCIIDFKDVFDKAS